MSQLVGKGWTDFLNLLLHTHVQSGTENNPLLNSAPGPRRWGQSPSLSAATSWGQSLQHPAFPSAPREQRPPTPLAQHLKHRLRPPASLPPGHQGSRGAALSHAGTRHPPSGTRSASIPAPLSSLARSPPQGPILPSRVVSLRGQTVQQLCTPRDSPPLVTLSSTVVSRPPFAFHPDLLFAKCMQSLFILV